MAYTKYSLTPANNTAAPPDGAPEGMLPSAVNDTMRDMMAQIRDCGDGIRDGTYTMTAPKITGGTITGSTINNSAIGGTTAAAGAFTSLTDSGNLTFTSTGNKILGDFSNATQSNRVAIQTSTTNGSTFVAAIPNGTGTTSQLQVVNSSDVTNASLGVLEVTSSAVSIYSLIRGTGTYVPMIFSTGGSERLRIDTSGNVGIGTSSPANPTGGRGFEISNASGSSIRATSSGTFLDLQSGGNANYILSSGATPLLFYTNSAERMRIDASGNLLVGTTTAISSGFTTISYNGTALNGVIISESASTSGTTFLGFNSGATNIGNVSRVGATNAVIYNTTSDQRLKSNIADANPVLDKLMTVKVRQFDWTEGDLHQDAGFIAQELAPVLSGIVTQGKTEEDMWQMDYARLTPYLVKAIQELNAKVEAQAAEIALLKSK